MDYSWLWIVVSVFLLVGGYFLRRRSQDRTSRYIQMVAVDVMCVALYGFGLLGPDKFHVAVFLLLIVVLSGATLFLHLVDRRTGGVGAPK